MNPPFVVPASHTFAFSLSNAALARFSCLIAVLVAFSNLSPSFAGIVSFDGDGTGGTVLSTPANWDTNALPVTTDQAVFTNAAYGGSLPASLTNGAVQTWGNLVWDSNSSTTFSGTTLSFSGSGGNVNGDLITLGSNMTSGTVTIGTASLGGLYSSSTGGRINVVNAGATLVINSHANMPNATITKTGAGTLTFNNGNNAGGGASAKFILEGGTLNFVNATGFGGGATTTLEIHDGTFLDNTNGSGLTLSRNFLQTWAGDFGFKGTGASLTTGTGAVTMTGSRQINSMTSGRALVVDGAIGDGGNGYGLTKVGAGNLQLQGANTYTGATASYGGGLTLSFNGAISPISNVINSSSSLVLGATTLTLTGKASTANTQTFNGVTVEAGATQITATAGATGGSMTLTTGTLTKEKGGTVNFTLPTTGSIAVSNANNAGGLLGAGITVGLYNWATVSSGTVAAFSAYTTQNAVGSWAANQNITSSAAFTGSLGSALTINSLRFNAANASTANLGTNTLTVLDGILLTNTVGSNATTISNGFIQGSSGGELIAINNSTGADLTISARVIDNGSATAFVKSGGQQVTLSNSANSYSGATYINAGSLRATATNVFGNNSAVVISQGATLALNNFSQTIGSLASNPAATTGAVTLGSGTLTTGGGNSSTRFVGTISGAGGLVKVGTGTQTLTGANTYTGSTQVNLGTLLVNGSLASGSSVSVNSGGALGGTGTVGGLVTTAGVTSVISPGNSPGTLTLSGGLDATAGARFVFELGTTSDLLSLGSGVLTGSSSANGLVFDFSDSGGLLTNTTYTLITFGSSSGLDYSDLMANTLPSGFVMNSGFGTNGFQINGNNLEVQFSTVPEPSTVVMFGLGLGCVLLNLRRKRSLN